MNTEVPRHELERVAMRKIQRGDSYASVLTYLKRNTGDAEVIGAIIQSLKEKETQGLIQQDVPKKTEVMGINQIMGYLFIFGGVALTVALWNRGYIFLLSPILIILGFYGIINKPIDPRK